MLVYIILILFNILFAFMTKKLYANGRKVYFWLSLIQLTLVSGLRGYNVGADTSAYVQIFNNIANIDAFTALFETREEIGYVFLNKIISLLGGNATILFLICAFITAYGLLKFIDNNADSLYFGVFLLLCFMFFFTSMNVIRQYLATAIGINAITYAKNKNYIKALLLIGISMLFHKLGAFYILIPLFFIAKRYKAVEIIFYIACLIVVIFSKPIITMIANLLGYEGYIESTTSTHGIMMPIVFLCVFGFVAVSSICYRKIYRNNKIEFFCLIVVVSLSIIALTTFQWANRIAWLLSPALIVLISNCCKELTVKDKQIAYIVICPLAFAYFIYCLYIGWQGITPYTLFWQ